MSSFQIFFKVLFNLFDIFVEQLCKIYLDVDMKFD